MGNKPHPPARSRKKDIIVTAVVCAALFGTVVYFQEQLYAKCKDFTTLKSIEQLQAYVERFIEESDSTDAAAENLMAVSKALSETKDNSTRLAAKQQELVELQDKLKKAQVELDAAKQRITSLEDQVKDLTAAQQQVTSLTSKVEQHTKDLASSQQQVQELTKQKEQLEKDKQQLQSEKQKLEQQQKDSSGSGAKTDSKQDLQPLIGAPNTSSAIINTAKLQVLAVAGEQCTPVQGYEFWFDPNVIWGYDHRAADVAECCAACHAHRRVVARGGTEQGKNSTSCRAWAFCGNADKCGTRLGECWLRGLKELPVAPNLPKDAHKSEGWVSGLVYDDENAYLDAYNDTALVFSTRLGDIEIELLPELAPASVRELRRAASILAPSGYCSNCRIYRPEKGFLVQGILEAPGAYVATPRKPNPPQRMVMEKGLMCWAGGGGGPHWFVNMIDQSGFKDDHLCFGLVKNLTLFDAILELPLKEKKNPSDMNGLAEDFRYNVTLKQLKTKQ